MSTLAELIVADVSDVFLNTSDFAETVRHYKAGDPTNYEDIAAIVDREEETKDGQSTTYAMTLDTDQGSEVRAFIRLEIASTIVVTEQGASLHPSRFRLADESQCKTVRIIGRDEGMQTVLCEMIDRRATRKAQG